MPKAGDSYQVILKEPHLGWGDYRRTQSREFVDGEAYIPIPYERAREFRVFNSNGTSGKDVLGENLFRCKSSDGFYDGILRAQGAKEAGDIYAKQFSENKNLKAIGDWYKKVHAAVGDKVLVEWTSATDILITKK